VGSETKKEDDPLYLMDRFLFLLKKMRNYNLKTKLFLFTKSMQLLEDALSLYVIQL
jgi:hypothetical protein